MDTNDVQFEQILDENTSHFVTRALLAAASSAAAPTTESADLEDPGELGK